MKYLFPNSEKYFQGDEYLAIILEFDTIAADYSAIREFTLKNSSAYVFGLSKILIHPELKEAICYHLFACLKKAVDPDELLYWLKSIV